jgi:Ser/Thr protein kinase RdoA (MazF antagonist)
MSLDGPIDHSYIAAHWPLTGVGLGPVLRVFDHRHVQVVTSCEGRHVLKTTNQWRDDRDAANHLSLPGYLADHGFPHAPRILPTRAGRLFQPWGSDYVYLLEYIEGRVPDPTPEVYERMGEMVAALHNVAGYPHPYLFTYQEVLPEFSEIAQRLPFADEYLAIVDAWPDFDTFPHSIIHGEVIGNILQSGDGTLVILDWDEAGLGPRLFDVGHPLVGSFITEDLQVRWDLMAAYDRGYLSHNRLTDLELAHIVDAALFYALRYIIWGDRDARWRRILWTLEHRNDLEAVIARAAPAHGRDQ